MIGLPTIIPNENRRQLSELAGSMTQSAFLDHIWKLRAQERRQALPASFCRVKASGTWPKLLDSQPALPPLKAETKNNISTLHARKAK